MKRAFPYLALLSLVCVSCGERTVFPYSNDPNYPYAVRNGENIGKSYSSLSKAATPGNIELVSGRIREENPFFLFLTQDNCDHCAASEHAFLSFLEQSEASAINVHDDHKSTPKLFDFYNDLLEAFPDYADKIPSAKNIGTPALFLVSSPSAIRYIPYQDTFLNAKAFVAQMKDLANYTHIYEFSTYASFVSFANNHDVLLCLKNKENESYYSSSLYGLAKATPAYTATVNLDGINEKEAALFAKEYGDKNVISIKKGGEVIASMSSGNDWASAENFAKTHYDSAAIS